MVLRTVGKMQMALRTSWRFTHSHKHGATLRTTAREHKANSANKRKETHIRVKIQHTLRTTGRKHSGKLYEQQNWVIQ
jgi:hypothetical protein